MSASIDRSCPNCGSYKNIGKVNNLYHANLKADGLDNTPGRRGPVVDRPKSAMTLKLSPPPKPTANSQRRYDIRATGIFALVAAIVISGALLPFLSWNTTQAIFYILMLVGIMIAAAVVQMQRSAAVKQVPQ